MENNEMNKIKMLQGLTKTDVTVDSANLAILDIFKDLAFTEGGDDSIAEFDHLAFTLNMVVRLTEQDIIDYDNDSDMLENYIRLRNQVLAEIK